MEERLRHIKAEIEQAMIARALEIEGRDEECQKAPFVYDARDRLHAIEEELANLLDRRAVVDDALATIDARIAAALAAHVAAENAELATTVPGWAERMRGEVVGK